VTQINNNKNKEQDDDPPFTLQLFGNDIYIGDGSNEGVESGISNEVEVNKVFRSLYLIKKISLNIKNNDIKYGMLCVKI
jgi:hypothetical protein